MDDMNPNDMTEGMDSQPLPDLMLNGAEPSTMTETMEGEQDIVGAPLDQQIDSEIVQMVTQRKKDSEQWRDPYRLEWDQATNHYEQVYDNTGKENWQATTFQPMTTTITERATASLHNMSMGPETPVEFQSRNTADEDQIDGTNEILQHDLEQSKFKVYWTDFLRSLSLYGTAVGKIDYVKSEETVMVKERKKNLFGAGLLQSLGSFFGMGQEQEEQEIFKPRKQVVKDWATFKNCDIYKIYPQPYTEEITKDTWVIEKFKIKNKELLEGARNPDEYYRLDNITPELLMGGQARTDYDPQTQEKRWAQNDTDVPMYHLDPDYEHEALEYWGPIPKWFLHPELREDPIMKYESVNAWIWVIDGQWVVRKRITPFIDGCPPYVKGNYIRRLGQFYGIGNGKLVTGLQIEKNEIRNTRQDNINLILNKIIGVMKDRVNKDDWDRLVSDPGAIWPFEGGDDIRKMLMPISMPDITQDAWRSSAEVDREAQEVTDVTKTTQTIAAGEDQAGNGTFRGQLLNQQQANERFMVYARVLEIIALNATINKYYQRIYQFKSYAQIDKILGPERAQTFELILPEEINSKAKLVSLGSLTTMNKGVQLAQMTEFYKLASADPYLKKLEYQRKMWRLIGAGSDPDEVLMSDQEAQMFNQMRRQMMMSGMGGEGMPGPEGMPGNPGAPPPGPIAGNVPGPTDGMPRPPMPARGPGASPADMTGRPLS